MGERHRTLIASPREALDAQQIDAICDRFEDQWSNHNTPELSDYLADAEPALRKRLLVELARTDLECRFRAGQSPRVERYLDLYPALREDAQAALTLILAERCLRQKAGDLADIAEYLDRFPEYVSQISALAETLQLDNSTLAESPAAKPDLPRQLGKFQLLDFLGQGAAGSVYRAHDAELDRTVAIKIPRAAWLAAGEGEQRFLREARHAAQLRHRCIVPVHEIGRSDGVPFIVSEFVEGRTLAETIAGGRRFSFEQAAALMAMIADALDHAHACGVVHRDLKPANVMLDCVEGEEIPRIMDFGLARRSVPGEESMTLEGQVIGTPTYMSPEQARGQGFKADGRTDVYSAGVILYELLTEEVPFRGNTRIVLNQVLHAEPRSPRRINDQIPLDLETICLKCLEKSPGNRYQTAQALAQELRRFQAGEPIRARPVGRGERAWRWCRRNPAIASVSAAAILALAAGVVVSLAFGLQARKQARIAQVESQRALQAFESEKKMRLTTQRYLYLTRMIEAEQARRAGNLARTRSLLNQYRTGEPELRELRRWEWSHLWRRCHPELRSIWCDIRPIRAVAVSPDGQLLAVGCSDGRVVCHDLTKDDRRRVFDAHQRTVTRLAFLDGGAQLASADMAGQICIWDVNDGLLLRSVDGPGGPALATAFAAGLPVRGATVTGRSVTLINLDDEPLHRQLDDYFSASVVDIAAMTRDGRRLAVASRDAKISIFAIDEGDEAVTVNELPSSARAICFDDDGDVLAAAVDRRVMLFATEDGSLMRELAPDRAEVEAISFSPAGQQLAIGRRDGSIQLVDAASGAVRLVHRSHLAPVLSLAFSEQGGLVSTSEAGVVKIWSTSPQLPYRDRLPLRPMALSSDSQRALHVIGVATRGEEKRLVSMQAGIESPRILDYGAATGVLTVRVSPDGQWMAAASRSGRLALWRVGQAAPLWDVDAAMGPLSAISFAPFGDAIAVGGDRGVVKLLDIRDGTTKSAYSPDEAAQKVTCLAFNSTGGQLAAGDVHGHVRRWRVSPTTPERTFSGHTGGVKALAYSPDNRLLASASFDETVKIWDIETGSARTLLGQGGALSAVAWDASGERLVAGGLDSAVRIYDVPTGELVSALVDHPAPIRALTFSPSGTELAAACSDGTVVIWTAASVDRWQAGRSPSAERADWLAAQFATHREAFAHAGRNNATRPGQEAEVKRELQTRKDDLLAITDLVAAHVHAWRKSTTHYGKAKRWVAEACHMVPDDPELLLIKAAVHLHLNEIEQADEATARLLTQAPQSPAAYALKAVILHHRQEFPAAESALRRAESLQRSAPSPDKVAEVYLTEARRLTNR